MAPGMRFGEALSVSFRREVAYVRRSAWDLSLLFVLPCLAILVMAAVFYSGVFHNVPVAVVDADHSALSRAVERDLLATPKVRVTARPADLSSAWPLVRSGKVYCVVYIPPGLEAQAARHEDGAVLIYFNAAFQTVASQAADAARNAVQARSRRQRRTDRRWGIGSRASPACTQGPGGPFSGTPRAALSSSLNPWLRRWC